MDNSEHAKKTLSVPILKWKPGKQKSIILSLLLLLFVKSHSQNISNYILLPGYSSILPVDEQMNIGIYWFGDDMTLHEGKNSFSGNQLPEWTVNGQPWTNQNPANGKLSVGFGSDHATYIAPSKIPATNPVVIAVKFQASDTSKEIVTLICSVTIVDPGNKWYVSFTYSGTNYSSDKSATEERTSSKQITGSASMLIKGTPPDEDGHVTINTSEGDTISSYSSSGQWTENILEISKDMNGVILEKTIRNHSGQPTKDKTGIEFEYDPAPGGIKGLTGAGLDFSGQGKDLFYVRDNNNRLIKKDEADGTFTTNILLGHDKDILKKASNGFTIDYIEKKDTSYIDALGAVHQTVLDIKYHVIISRKAFHRAAWNQKKTVNSHYTIFPSFICNTRSLNVANSSLCVTIKKV
ncbi:MAG: hypothetical protein JST17_03435 [Bacteroidetes bacterium]|nr:hypothetical protein [Bacteroidota bacterium]MBS1929461.1 hypothetical protein [Bacteroidota bacterium]